MDIVGQLHASYKFSPYLRLPFQGVEINRELSFVAPSFSERLCKAKDKESLEKIMSRLAQNSRRFSFTRCAENVERMYQTIVVITDLPIEWLF